MGTTVTAVLIGDRELEFVSVGDSRIYRWRADALTQLTQDDSWLSHARANGNERLAELIAKNRPAER